MNDVRCSSCGRRLAITGGASALRNRVFCGNWCARELGVTPTEVRTDCLAALHQVLGLSPLESGRPFGLAHSQVYVALDRINARWK